jgi:hypothetical protein
MLAKTVKRGLSVTVVGLALALVGPGAVTAANAATYVVSDKVNFSAQLVPNPTGTGFILQNQTCTLTSDGEPAAGVPCQISGQLTPTGPTTATLTTTVTSADGQTTSTATISITSAGSYSGKGKGRERDNTDTPGTPPPPPYPCKVKTMGTIAGGVITGTMKVKEASTLP